MKTRSEVMDILATARTELARLYGPRLRGVYLFGSYARDEATDDSDIDIAVVLDEISDRFAERELTSELFTDLTLDSGVLVSRVFITQADYVSGGYGFYQAIRREGVAA